ncbi:hypothetical protein DFH28DRAFT_921148 [Melampsora americana]|nr:hypothetical protein DFH28DRAFT_921148 [Melampsora americana]
MPPCAPIRAGLLPHEHDKPKDDQSYHLGTEARRLLEEAQSFTVAVLFKIHTNNRVDVPPANRNPAPKFTTGKKDAPPAPTFAVIDSLTFKNNRVLESQAFLYGKSLNDFKDLISNICDEYKKGTKKVVLDSPLSPLLTWNATVGSKKLQLVDYKTYQQFVDNLGKSRTRKGVINITLENAQAKAKRDAQASGGVAYIQGLNGPSSIEEELQASKEETAAARQETREVKAAKDLELEALTIYAKHLKRALGGDGTILAAPWDPTYFYRFTHRCAFLWAKAIRDGYTTRAIPPSTTDYKKEMAKNAVNHQDANVDSRVKKRYPVPIPSRQSPRRSTAEAVLKRRNFFANAPIKIKEEPMSPPGYKRDFEHMKEGSVSSFKKIKQESYVYDSDSDVCVVQSHSSLLEDFLGECNIAVDDLATRVALRNAKVESWTDLIPSQQMTANVLTTAGMSYELAKRLIDAAKEADAHFQRHSIPK